MSHDFRGPKLQSGPYVTSEGCTMKPDKSLSKVLSINQGFQCHKDGSLLTIWIWITMVTHATKITWLGVFEQRQSFHQFACIHPHAGF